MAVKCRFCGEYAEYKGDYRDFDRLLEGCSNFTRRLALAVSPRYEIYYCRDCDSVLFVDPDDTTRQDGGNIPGLGW